MQPVYTEEKESGKTGFVGALLGSSGSRGLGKPSRTVSSGARGWRLGPGAELKVK